MFTLVLLILNSIDKEIPSAIQMETIRTGRDAYCYWDTIALLLNIIINGLDLAALLNKLNFSELKRKIKGDVCIIVKNLKPDTFYSANFSLRGNQERTLQLQIIM